MANIQFIASGNVAVTGITPAAGPKPTVNVTAAYNSGAIAADDYMSDTFVVNANTTATAINIGKIADGALVELRTTGPLLVTLEQDLGAGPVDVVMKVDSYLLLVSGFTALSVANPSLTVAVQMSTTVLGDRIPVGGGPGVY